MAFGLHTISTRFGAPFNVAAEGLEVMVKPSEIHQAHDRPKARIGRARFVLECIVALALLKAASSSPTISTLALGAGFPIVFWLAEKRLRNIGQRDWWIVVLAVAVILVYLYGLFCVLSGMPRPGSTIKTDAMPMLIVEVTIPLLVGSLGNVLTIWACVKRLRDIRRSAWWVTVVVVPIVVVFIYGLIYAFQGQLPSGPYIKAVETVWMILFLLFAGALLSKESAFPKRVGPEPLPVPQPGAEESNAINEPTGISASQSSHATGQKVPRMNQLNGWQRVGVVLSILWCVAVGGIAANDYYQAYSHYSGEATARADFAACKERTRASPGKSTEPCGMTLEMVRGVPNIKPTLPPVLPLLAWLLLPVVLGWLLVHLTLRAAQWVRDGFKAK